VSDTLQGYSLLDSGNLMKLERYGDKVLARPSTVCIWNKRLSGDKWQSADARYIPGKDESSGGWQFKSERFETWNVEYLGCKLELRLQSNGQLGLFPEHGSYLPELAPHLEIAEKAATPAPKVLNLFAYTGLASVYFAKRGWDVTHVDLAKKALTWAQINFQKNELPEKRMRLICDDAVKFLEREVRRGTKYDAVVLDPPSFSRITKQNFWKIDEQICALVRNATAVSVPERPLVVVTCHDPGMRGEMLANVLLDVSRSPRTKVERRELSLPEEVSGRLLSSGSLAVLTVD
jgi:23S rRNA (cytosine1962-C5)-methyltransferase